MEWRQALEHINHRPELVFKQKARKSGWICPLCGNGSGKDGTGVKEDPSRPGHFKCFKCGVGGSVLDWVAQMHGMNPDDTPFREILRKGCEVAGIFVDDAGKAGKGAAVKVQNGIFIPQEEAEGDKAIDMEQAAVFVEDCMAQKEKAFPYLEGRGISKETAARMPIGWHAGWVYFFSDDTNPAQWEARNTNPNAGKGDRYLKATGVEVKTFWGEKALHGMKPVFVTEGIMDALSLSEAGINAVALGGVSNAARFTRKAAGCPLPIIAVLDNDEAGNKATAVLVDAGAVDGRDVLGESHDANDALRENREAFIEAVKEVERIHGYREQQSMAGRMAAIRERIRHNRLFASTGFKNLDKILGGGLYPGLYIMGAISAAGKTTFSLQVADAVARQGRDVLLFSLEMSEAELAAKSISRIMADGNARATTREILLGSSYDAARQAAIDDAWKEYAKYADHIFIMEGQGDVTVSTIRERVEAHFKQTGCLPLVLVDYLQIIAGDPRHTDKQKADMAVVELKRLSRDFDIPVWAVSSFNRENYSNDVSLTSFKESGAIEYGSDVLLGMQYRGMSHMQSEAEKDKNSRIRRLLKENREKAKAGIPVGMELKVLKNRNGYCDSCYFAYTHRSNNFMEQEEDEALDWDEPITCGGIPTSRAKVNQKAVDDMLGVKGRKEK